MVPFSLVVRIGGLATPAEGHRSDSAGLVVFDPLGPPLGSRLVESIVRQINLLGHDRLLSGVLGPRLVLGLTTHLEQQINRFVIY